jgi:predicted methyltransferase
MAFPASLPPTNFKNSEDAMSRLWMSAAVIAAISSVSVLAYAAAPAYVEAALADAGRTQADRDADAMRKPADMVEFAGIKPGSHVVDISPGAGYFTRIFAKVVGPNGKVYAVSNPPRQRPAAAPAAGGAPAPAAGAMQGMQGMGGAPAAGGRAAGSNLMPPGAPPAPPLNQGYPNVELVQAPVAIAQGFTLPEKVDVVWTSRNYHDFKNASDDLTAFNKAVFDALKPGGVFIVLDHAADESDTPDVTRRLHRIQESRVKADVQAVGFKLVGESNVLRNPQDNKRESNSEADVRGHTDQFILKFQKPN